MSEQAAGSGEASEQEQLGRLARTFLAERYTMALATDGPDGLWVASVYFAGGPGRLYFLSSPESRHGCNLAASPRVAAAINADEHDWRQIAGIQLDGECRLVASPLEHLRAWRTYLGKFPMVRELFRRARGPNPSPMAARLLRTRMYCLTVGHLFYLDNRLGFGNRRELLDLGES